MTTKPLIRAALLSGAALLIACSSTVQRPPIDDARLGLMAPVEDGESIGEAANSKPTPRTAPWRLAVIYRPQRGGPEPSSHQHRIWREAFRESERIGEVVLVSDFLSPPSESADLEALRLAAARLQADAVLIYSGAVATEWSHNLASLTYLTGFGLFFFQGTDIESVFAYRGALVDTRSGFLYFVTDAETRVTASGPWALLDEEEVVGRASEVTLEKLSSKVAQLIEDSPDLRQAK
ncbi:MAG: hypothetical protein RL885_33245 [Planctomycetota bacterium]